MEIIDRILFEAWYWCCRCCYRSRSLKLCICIRCFCWYITKHWVIIFALQLLTCYDLTFSFCFLYTFKECFILHEPMNSKFTKCVQMWTCTKDELQNALNIISVSSLIGNKFVVVVFVIFTVLLWARFKWFLWQWTSLL